MGDGDRQLWHQENPDLGSDGGRGWGMGAGGLGAGDNCGTRIYTGLLPGYEEGMGGVIVG